MLCDKCESSEHVKTIKGIGNRCYNCFDDQIMKLIEFQDNWLEEDILPEIKVEISDNIMKKGEEFNIKQYIADSPHSSEILERAIEEMLQGNALPEIVRICLNAYTGNIMDYVEGDNYDEG